MGNKPKIFVLCSIFLFYVGSQSVYARTFTGVPFTSQAPFGNWAEPYQDYCEEASAAMAAHWIWGVSFTPAIANLEMGIISRFEDIVFGHSADVSIKETATVLTTLYGFKHVSLKTVAGRNDLIEELNNNHILLVPALGRALGNPYFTPPGPLYHMLVVRGYDARSDEFIANDPGTRHGNGIRYAAAMLVNAIHDWNNGDVAHGEKVMLVVGK